MVPPDDAAPATDDADDAAEAVEAIEAESMEAARRAWLAATDERIAALGQRAERFSAPSAPPPDVLREEAPRAVVTEVLLEEGQDANGISAFPTRWGRTTRRGRGGVS